MKWRVEGVEPAAPTFAIFDVWREDVARPGLTQEEALRNAPRSAQGLFIVPKVIVWNKAYLPGLTMAVRPRRPPPVGRRAVAR
ncbi:hypothetical protein BH20VER3_BH20VER3_14840 [soil metagenome]